MTGVMGRSCLSPLAPEGTEIPSFSAYLHVEIRISMPSQGRREGGLPRSPRPGPEPGRPRSEGHGPWLAERKISRWSVRSVTQRRDADSTLGCQGRSSER